MAWLAIIPSTSVTCVLLFSGPVPACNVREGAESPQVFHAVADAAGVGVGGHVTIPSEQHVVDVFGEILVDTEPHCMIWDQPTDSSGLCN